MTRSQIVGDHQVNGTKTNNFVRDSFEIMHASATVWVRANLYGYCCRVGNIDILYVGLTGAANALYNVRWSRFREKLTERGS